MNLNIGLHVPEILIPSNAVDYSTWSVVACDQYTSQPDYWKEVQDKAQDLPSCYHITLPEIYLEEGDFEDRIEKINSQMQEYLNSDVLSTLGECLIYVKRNTRRGNSRNGLIMAIDLEKYDFSIGSGSLIRATEGTVIERLPPRVKIRQNAPLELPHIMLLIDDRDKTVIEPLDGLATSANMIYKFDLMMDSGNISGYKISDLDVLDRIQNALEKLANVENFNKKYSLDGAKDVLLFAVGDGNHSLASAKQHWDKVATSLTDSQKLNHPARFALVEVVNIHDQGLKFEPIHRVVFNMEVEELNPLLTEYCASKNCSYSLILNTEFQDNNCASQDNSSCCEAKSVNSSSFYKKGTHVIPFISGCKSGSIIFESAPYNLEVGTLQSFLDFCCTKNSAYRIDYIHGFEVVEELSSQQGNIGFLLPPMDKNELFKTVILEGALPRKTFSMGEADEKRFYLECRRISL